MKIKQTVTAKFNTVYTGWNSLQFTDDNGDEIEIQMTDDNYLDLAKTVNSKAERIRRERAEEAAKLEEENANE
tara:strand:- start:200 stop:418 length:219 start_codon:yes stop_codon:yes gene_type:complete